MERPARPGLSMSLAITANIVATRDIQFPKTSDIVPKHLYKKLKILINKK